MGNPALIPNFKSEAETIELHESGNVRLVVFEYRHNVPLLTLMREKEIIMELAKSLNLNFDYCEFKYLDAIIVIRFPNPDDALLFRLYV